jgi:hypothetical protein
MDFNSSSFWEQAPGVIAIVLIFGGGAIVGVISLILHAWRGNRDSERLAILKQQMLDKGMSADEIVRVIEAGKPDSGADRYIRIMEAEKKLNNKC